MVIGNGWAGGAIWFSNLPQRRRDAGGGRHRPGV